MCTVWKLFRDIVICASVSRDSGAAFMRRDLLTLPPRRCTTVSMVISQRQPSPGARRKQWVADSNIRFAVQQLAPWIGVVA